MFLVRRAIWLLRLYTNVLLVGVMIIAVDVDLQAKAAGQTITSYDRMAYIETVQRRLRGETLRGPASPLDVSMMAYRGVLQARLAILGLEAPGEDVALLPTSVQGSGQAAHAGQFDAAYGQTLPGDATSGAAEDAQRPCVRRGNVLDC
ncbi:hypothetical protein MHM88_15270 [Epibacterium sp. MM17-32]|uniref:hypothetical protein n=1 Tax=Epibacterium sp. MM17-32 TaxID=2917734 RepID=UPI001EF68BEF|nr:hypothetical protein [Epibacterium sp. MM17-32]MCG7629169.1 hypothetical protein [Epibacterium sp. MM17-32]